MPLPRFLLLSLLLTNILIGFGQVNSKTVPFKKTSTLSDSINKVSWLKRNVVAIRTIDPADEDFSDLADLKKWVLTCWRMKVECMTLQKHGRK
jgi:hypothetical protein